MSINPTTGLISGVIDELAFLASPYQSFVKASNSTLSRAWMIEWNVASSISIDIDLPQNLLGRELAAVSLGPINTTNFYGRPVTLSVSGLPVGLAFDPDTRLISGTIAVGAAQNGPYQVTIDATDGIQSTSYSFELAVTGITLLMPPLIATYTGESVNRQIQATTASGARSYSAHKICLSGFPSIPPPA